MIHRPCPMIGWSLVSSRLFSEQGACRGLRPEALWPSAGQAAVHPDGTGDVIRATGRLAGIQWAEPVAPGGRAYGKCNLRLHVSAPSMELRDFAAEGFAGAAGPNSGVGVGRTL